eukprot:superscaffoldBa00001080_g8857
MWFTSYIPETGAGVGVVGETGASQEQNGAPSWVPHPNSIQMSSIMSYLEGNQSYMTEVAKPYFSACTSDHFAFILSSPLGHTQTNIQNHLCQM